MNKPDVAKILTAIYTYERRLESVGISEVETWFPLLEDLEYEQVRRAVTAHFLASDRYLTVARLRELVTQEQRKNAPVQPSEDVDLRTRVPDADPDDPVAYMEAIRDGRWQPTRERTEKRALDTSALGRRVPRVSAEEAADDAPRPRRWWMLRKTKEADETET